MIYFNKPPVTGAEIAYIHEAIEKNAKLCGDGVFTKKCQAWLEKPDNVKKALLTPSCTAALELAALLIDIQPGDEVIMPSYTFVSTANAFVLRGARIVFVDIRADNMNIDEQKIEAAISKNTKAIVPVHYAGVACEMNTIMAIAKRHNLFVIEDAAQAVNAFYHDKPLGSIGHFGCFSFHETKNYTSGGEGGALLINDEQFIERAEIIREKGTNRSQFLRGQVDKYTWRDLGSSFLPSEIQAAYLWAQFEAADIINNRRIAIWDKYHSAFASLERDGLCVRPAVATYCTHNGHMYYLRLPSEALRSRYIDAMKQSQVQTVFHYIPLHSSPAGLKYGVMSGIDHHTTPESLKLVRLPLWFNLTDAEVDTVVKNSVYHLSSNR